MDGELRQHQAAQILISGAVFELVSLSQSVTRGTRWWVEKATQQREKEFTGLSESIRIWSHNWRMPLLLSQQKSLERERREHHLYIDVLLSCAR